MITSLQEYTGSVLGRVLTDKQVSKQGLDFIDRTLRHPQTHEAALVLLIHALNDSRFLDQSKTFATEVLAWVIQQPQTQEHFKLLVIATLQDSKVREETIQVLKYLTEQKATEEILARYMKEVFLR